MITAKVIADSVSEIGVRVTTLQLLYPRFIHSEFMTHRVFSRNASSSRAIPVSKIIDSIKHDPAMPVSWGKNQKGMQAGEEVDYETYRKAEAVWLAGRDAAVVTAKALIELGIHKQIANRVLEPWAHISVIVTATEWRNFFELRDHKDAQPEIAQLARVIKVAMDESKPKTLVHGAWHLPYVTDQDILDVKAYAATQWATNTDQCQRQFPDLARMEEYLTLQVSAARCARVSYNTHEGKRPLVLDDITLAERLSSSKHMSPFEHQATPCSCGSFHANLRGHFSFRSLMEETERVRVMHAQGLKTFVENMEAAGYTVEGIGRVQ